MSAGTIILAEDNPNLRKLYADVFKEDGFSVLCANNGEEALRLLHKVSKPKIIILDIMMPKLDGIETCKRAQSLLGGQVPILFLTSLEDPETVLECLEAGGDDYLIKSGSLHDLVARVRHWARADFAVPQQGRRSNAIEELSSLIKGTEEKKKTLDELGRTVKELIDLMPLSSLIVPSEFQSPTAEQTFKLGYISGFVFTWDKRSIASNSRYRTVLRRILTEVHFAETQEIETVLDNFDRLSKQSAFKTGWENGHKGEAQSTAAKKLLLV